MKGQFNIALGILFFVQPGEGVTRGLTTIYA